MKPLIQPDPEERACETCGKPFFAAAIVLFGAKISARHCQPCVDAENAKQAPRLAKLEPLSAEAQHEAAWAALCDVEFRLTTESNGRTNIERLHAECPKLGQILGYKAHRGLMLKGATGRCKTRAMWRLVRQMHDAGKSIVALTAGELGRSYGDAAGQYQASQWFDRLSTVDALFVDDLGKASWSEAVKSVFFDLVDKRTRTGKPMLITTNDGPGTIGDRLRDESLAPPLVRRLREFCECIDFDS